MKLELDKVVGMMEKKMAEERKKHQDEIKELSSFKGNEKRLQYMICFMCLSILVVGSLNLIN